MSKRKPKGLRRSIAVSNLQSPAPENTMEAGDLPHTTGGHP